MKRFLRRQFAIICAALIFASPLAAQDDPNALMDDAISLYTTAMAANGEERYRLFQEVDRILTRIETEFPDSAPASVMQLGIPLGPIDQSTLEAELAASAPKLADKLSGELAEQWAILQERSPDVAATVEEALKEVSGSAADETKEELYVKVTYYVMAAFYYVSDTAFQVFFDPSEAGELYKAFVKGGSLDTALSDIGRSGATDIALGVALDFATSTIADFAVKNAPEMSASARTLVHAAIKATITEVLLAVQASKDPTKIPGLGIKRVSDLVDIFVTTRGLAADVDTALTETALRMQTMAQLTASYREQEGVQDIITSTRQNLASELEGAVGKDDAKAVSDIMLLGWAALTAEFQGETAQAENLHDLLLSRGNVSNMPTIWNAPDLAVYFANGFADSPKRAAEIMIGLTELSRYSKAPEPLEAVTTPSTSPDLAGAQIAPDGFWGPGAVLQADGGQAAMFDALPNGLYAVDPDSCGLTEENVGDAWGVFFRLLDKPKARTGYYGDCTIVGRSNIGDAVAIDWSCSGEEGEVRTSTTLWRVSGPGSFTDLSVDGLAKEFVYCSDSPSNGPDVSGSAAGDWGASIVPSVDVGYRPCHDRQVTDDCLRELGLSDEAIRFSFALAKDYSGSNIATLFKELGEVDLAVQQWIGADVHYYPVLLNGILGLHPVGGTRNFRTVFTDEASQSMLERFPMAQNFAYEVRSHRRLPDGTQRFVLVESVTEQCRVCPILGAAVTFLDIGPSTNGALHRRPVGLLLGRPEDSVDMTAEVITTRPESLQVSLNTRGYDAGPMDGYLGPQTRQALMEFQVENCLPPTGQPDPATVERLLTSDEFSAPCAGARLPEGISANNPLRSGVFVDMLSYCETGDIPFEVQHLSMRIIRPDSITYGAEGGCETKRSDIRTNGTLFRGTCFEGNQSFHTSWTFDLEGPDAFIDVTMGGQGVAPRRFARCADDSALREKLASWFPGVRNTSDEAGGPGDGQVALLFEPERGDPLRTLLLDTLRPSAEQAYGAPVEFMVETMRIVGDRAFVVVDAQRPGGQLIDWSQTPGVLAGDISLLSGDPGDIQAIMQLRDRRWVIERLVFHPTEAWWLEDCDRWGGLFPDQCGAAADQPLVSSISAVGGASEPTQRFALDGLVAKIGQCQRESVNTRRLSCLNNLEW